MIYKFAVITSILLQLISAVDYLNRTKKGKVAPALATWILLLVMMGMMCFIYKDIPDRSWTANVGLAGGITNIIIILLGLIIIHLKKGTLRAEFDTLQKGCLAFSTIIFFFWLATEQPLISYLLVQLVALVAYYATAKKLWHANTEPYFLWVVLLTAYLLALYPATIKEDLYAWIHLGRTIPSTALIILLIARAKNKVETSGF